MTLIKYILRLISGADPGFQARGADLKKLRRVEGGANIFGVFRVKKITILRQFFFPQLYGGGKPPGSVPGASIQKLINIDRRKLVEILVLILKK